MPREARTKRKQSVMATRILRKERVRRVIDANKEYPGGLHNKSSSRYLKEDIALETFFKRKQLDRRELLGKEGYDPHGYSVILHEAKNAVGSLKGKRLLLVSEMDFFSSFLAEMERAKVTSHNASVQALNTKVGEGNFDAIMANRVFQIQAFKFNTKIDPAILGLKEINPKWHLIHGENSLENHLRLRRVSMGDERHLPGDLINTPEKKKRLLSFLKNRSIERTNVLLQFASKLKKGGFILLCCQNEKVVFKPQEATQAGFRILKMNVVKEIPPKDSRENDYSYAWDYWYVTILQKK